MSRRSTLPLVAIALATAFASCDRCTIHSQYAHTGEQGWERTDTVVFEDIAIPKGGVYAEAIGVRFSSGYPFRSLTVVVEQTARPSGATHTDTLNMQLVAGNGRASGGGVSLRQYRFPLRSLTLQEGDTLSVRIHHNMKRETLPGIVDVGAWVERQ